jgi:signal transduction histidine kinase
MNDLRVLTNLIRAASAGPADVDSLLGRMCASLGDAFGFERVDAYRYLPLASAVQLISGDGRTEPLDHHPLLRRALDAGEPILEGSEVAAPLITADEVIGFLAGTCTAPCEESQQEVLAACAALVALALQRALEQDELERVGKLKTNFIALASHELRAPAAIVHGIAKTIEARAREVDPERISDLQGTLVEQTERLTRLIEELLDLSRLEASGVDVKPERVEVRRRIEDVVEGVAGDRRDEIAVEVDPDLHAVVDPNVLERIVSNLVTNALRYGDTPISIRAQQQDRHFRLTVEDCGEGVAPSFVPHLFERFSRASAGLPKEGAGLGLSIAQTYATAHGGHIFYEDATPSGARFQLVLPAPHD